MLKNEKRNAIFDLDPQTFKKIGHSLIDQLSLYLDALPEMPITRSRTVDEVREALGNGELPREGTGIAQLVEELPGLLIDNSLHNGHPSFWGYIMGSPSPAGALVEVLASLINPNMGGWQLAPISSEVELQAIRWMAQLVGFPADCGGILVSGGNMANMTAFLAARKAMADWPVREQGLRTGRKQLTVYASSETHTWVQKATDLFGIGTENIRWIKVDSKRRIQVRDLENAIRKDLEEDFKPMIVIGTAGTVSTGTVDPLDEIAGVCEEHGIWFHVDGAYGAPAACVESQKAIFQGMEKADSLALDPHKWLYAPIEAGCTLVRDKANLLNAYSYRPPYYHFDEDEGINFYELGFQNSRGFRALKVWVNMKMAGLDGYRTMIGEDIALAEYLAGLIGEDEELELKSQSLSIVTFRYAPTALELDVETLNKLNESIMVGIQRSGRAFLTNALIEGEFLLRVCIVNFRTGREHVDRLPGMVKEVGKGILSSMK